MANVATMPDVQDVRTTRRIEAQNILRRSVVLVLSCSFQGNHRKASLEDVVRAATGRDDDKVNGDLSKQITTNAHLVDSKVLTAANAVASRAKAYLRSKGIPAHRVFGQRAYLIPVEVVEEVDATLAQFAAEVDAEAEKVANVWEQAMAEQFIALGPALFKARNYPTRDEVRRAYSIDWNYVSFQAPERLEHVNRSLFESAQRRYEGRMSEAFSEVKLVLRQSLLSLTGEIAKKLRPGDDGKPKVFRDTILDGLTEFLSTFNVRNISDDAELEQVVTTLKGLTKDVDPQTLRDIDTVRENVLSGVQAAVDQLDELVQTGRRGISFGGL